MVAPRGHVRYGGAGLALTSVGVWLMRCRLPSRCTGDYGEVGRPNRPMHPLVCRLGQCGGGGEGRWIDGRDGQTGEGGVRKGEGGQTNHPCSVLPPPPGGKPVRERGRRGGAVGQVGV